MNRLVADRPLHALHAFSKAHHGIWSRVDDDLRKHPIAATHSHAFCGLPHVYSAGPELKKAYELYNAVLFAGWRTSLGIYRYHPSLLRELLGTDVRGDIPVEHLRRLPQYTVYIDMLGDEIPPPGATRLVGAFAAVTVNGRGRELFVLGVLCDRGFLTSIVLDMEPGTTIEESIRKYIPMDGAPTDVSTIASHFAPALSLVLYLCAADAESFDEHGQPPCRPVPRIDKQGRHRIYGAQAPVVYSAGYRLGAALDRARGAQRDAASDACGRRVVPHVRRAHWHTYLTGPRSGEQVRALKWLPPIPVNIESHDSLIPVVRNVAAKGAP